MVELSRRSLTGQQERTEIDTRGFKTRELLTKASPSIRVSRAKTRLTVYRPLPVNCDEFYQLARKAELNPLRLEK
jgi:hypothetical protein